MEQQQLYLFDILVKDLVFDLDVHKPKIRNNVRMTVACNQFLKVDIEAKEENISEILKPGGLLSYIIGFYTGKSCLFPSSPMTLLTLLETKELEVIATTYNKDNDNQNDSNFNSSITLATTTIKWPREFVKLVKESENYTGKINPVDVNDQFDIFDDSKKKIGYVNMFFCLHCFGKNIQVDFHVMGANIDVNQFKNRLVKTNLDGNITDAETIKSQPQEWLPLFKSPHKERFSRMDPELRIFAELAGITIPDTPQYVEELTPEYINKNLCGKKVCPGAIKFKEFGLGPLSIPTNLAGLGTIYNDKTNTNNEIKPHGMYGLSQTYGNLNYYGAFGLLRKQRHGETETNRNIKDSETVDEREIKLDTCGGETCPYVYIPRKLELQTSTVHKGNSFVNGQGTSQRRKNASTYSKYNGDPPKKSSRKPAIVKQVGNSACKNCMRSKDDNSAAKIPNYGQNKFINQSNQQNCFRLSGGADQQSVTNEEKKIITEYYNRSNDKVFSTSRNKQPVYNNNVKRSNFGKYSDQICPLSSGWRNNQNTENKNTVELASDQRQSFKKDMRNAERKGKSSYKVNHINTNLEKNCNICPKLSKQPTQRVVIPESTNEHYCCDSSNNGNTDERNESYYDNRNTLKLQSYSINADSTLSLSNVTNLYMFAKNRHVSQSMNNYCDMGSYRSSKHVNDTLRYSKNITDGVQEHPVDYNANIDFNHDIEANIIASIPDVAPMATRYSKQYDTQRCSKDITGGVQEYPVDLNANVDFNHDIQANIIPTQPCYSQTCKAYKYKTTCSECGGISRSGATCDNKSIIPAPMSSTSIAYNDNSKNNNAKDVLISSKQQDINAQLPLIVPAKSTEDDKRKKINDKNASGKNSVKINDSMYNKSRFVYHAGEYYSGIRVGHKMCINSYGRNVPSDMGWLWNIDAPGLKKRRGWRPGLLSKIINDKIIQRRQDLGIPNPPELKMLVRKTKAPRHREEEEEIEDEIEPKPTLIIQKKDGCYLITMNPLKDPKTIEENENPYLDCSPMQFFISKPKTAKGNKENANNIDNGITEHTNNYQDCACDENLQYNEDGNNDDECDSSESSELNIEFTTPAGIILPERMKRKPNEVYVESQFREDDYNCSTCAVITPKYQRAKKAVRLKIN